jgi:hypothetical protein
MNDLVFTARRLVESNLGWFLKTRSTLGEGAGNERAVNINREVLDAWYPDLAKDQPIDIRTRYLDGEPQGPFPSALKLDSRTIRNQGGGKNWRLAGDAIGGSFYDMRIGDIMFMVFDRPSNSLSWLVVRNPASPGPRRVVSPNEGAIHARILSLLGPEARNMWLVPHSTAAQIITALKPIYPMAGVLLMEDKAILESWLTALAATGFVTANEVSRRLVLSLKAKRFVILTGLSGSGKTLLARSFARWICASRDQYRIVPVGANWTSNDNILGYADALDPTRYQTTPALDLILHAVQNPSAPHFLILDEMNLSHVERYFADLLSAMEATDEPIKLHSDAAGRSGVPSALSGLPANLFIIGTVNVDETTYMFSPKVLDRANVIEFRVPRAALDSFLSAPAKVTPNSLDGMGASFGQNLVDASNRKISESDFGPDAKNVLKDELLLMFELLSEYELEFGFRSSYEILGYAFFERIAAGEINSAQRSALLQRVLDIQILQKLLPRLHGSRKRLEPILNDLAVFCATPHDWTGNVLANRGTILAAIRDQRTTPETPTPSQSAAFYTLSFDKIQRMLSRVKRNGFASFAEA